MLELPTISSKAVSKTKFAFLWEKLQEVGASMVVWSLPSENQVHFIADFDAGNNEVNLDDLDYEGLRGENPSRGFLISPFLTGEKAKSKPLFLHPHLYFTRELGMANWKVVEVDDSKKIFLERWLKQVNDQENVQMKNRMGKEIKTGTDKEDYLELVSMGVDAIKSGGLEKVVLARTLVKKLPDSFDLMTTFNNLPKTYPNAFTALVHCPQGVWMLASPELLLSQQDATITTHSIAGTQPYNGQDIARVGWQQKEIEEQAMVSRYIIQQFKSIRLREFDEIGPRNHRAGDMIHLKTSYSIDLKEVDRPNLAALLLKLLHPTSAVGGMPRQAALDFIQQHESFDRGLYSGFLGPVNLTAGVLHLFVNLRTMKLIESKLGTQGRYREAILYAGAGVTQDSDPELEWQETQLKCGTLLKVLF